MSRRAAMILTTVGLTACSPTAEPAERALMRRGADYLWSIQNDDGGWHSTVYGLMGSGQSLTAFVLHSLAESPDGVALAPAGAVERAVAFVIRNTDEHGCLGRADTVADYPNYATSLAAQALETLGRAPEHVARMREYLRSQQFSERHGWEPEHPAFGAWGAGGDPRTPPHHGHLDLSMSRHVMEALAGDPIVAPAARHFLARSQGADGGFSFSTVQPGANKAGASGDGFASYGTTTADGVLGLLATGVATHDPRVERAVTWLTTHHRTDRVPGLIADRRGGWSDGLRFYYLAASSRVFARLGIERAGGVDWRHRLRSELAPLQHLDGSWRNWCPLVKEDDPAIATALALQALTAAERRQS